MVNLIKIKQELEILWSTQNWRYLTRVLDQIRCKLGTFEMQTDRWDPPVSERERESAGIKKRKKANTLRSRNLNYVGPTAIVTVYVDRDQRRIILV